MAWIRWLMFMWHSFIIYPMAVVVVVVVIVRVMRTNAVSMCFVNGLVNDHFFIMCGCLFPYGWKMKRKKKKKQEIYWLLWWKAYIKKYQLTRIVERRNLILHSLIRSLIERSLWQCDKTWRRQKDWQWWSEQLMDEKTWENEKNGLSSWRATVLNDTFHSQPTSAIRRIKLISKTRSLIFLVQSALMKSLKLICACLQKTDMCA